MHAATRAGLSLVTPSGKTKHRVHWWTSDCTMVRNRTRLFFHIWKELGRPKYGQAYECYRAARKAYKTTCRSAVNSVVHTNHRKLSRILACKRTWQFWNEVNRAKIAANERQECNISLDTLEEYFRDTFDVKDDQNSELVTKHDQTVGEKYEQLQHREYQVDISEQKIKKYILQLKSGKAVGADDISSEHYLGHQYTPRPEQYTGIMFTIWYCNYTRDIFTWDTDTHIQERKGSRGSQQLQTSESLCCYDKNLTRQ